MTDDRYPIGPFDPPATVTANDRERYLAALEAAPDRLRAAGAGLSRAQLGKAHPTGTAVGRCGKLSTTHLTVT